LLFPTFSKTKKTHLDVAAEQLYKELNPTKPIEYKEGYVPEENEYDAEPISDSEDKAITPLVPTTAPTNLPASVPAVVSTVLPAPTSATETQSTAVVPTFIPTSAQSTAFQE
jgi:hypothetical protein